MPDKKKSIKSCKFSSDIYLNLNPNQIKTANQMCENIIVLSQRAKKSTDANRAIFAKELDIRDIVNNIKKIARDKEIKLKMFNKQLENLIATPTQVKNFIFKSSCNLLQKLILQSKLPIMEKNSYQTSLGKNYIKRGEKGFDLFNSYNEVIYSIHSLIDMGTTTDMYIGHTEKSKEERFKNEIDNAIKAYANEWNFPSRLIEKAILIAILDVITNFGIDILGEKVKYIDLGDFIKEYLSMSKNIRLSIRKELANILLGEFFEIRFLEKHYTKEEVSDREKWYKENYPNSNGTVFPYGLNMHNFIEGSGKYIALPLYDIAFMLSLGFRVPEISKLIKKFYFIKEATEDNVYARITQFFNSVEHAEDILLRPIVQIILRRFSNLSGDEIGKLIHREGGRQFFASRGCPFKRWFGDINLRELKKAVIIDDFSWNDLNYFIEEIRKGNYIRGLHKSQWIKLFIREISNEELSKIAGYKYKDSFRKHFFDLEESKKAFNVPNRKEAVKKYRKFITIKIIKNSKCPSFSTFEYLYTKVFGFQSRKEYVEKYKDYSGGDYFFERALKKYFKKLFNGISIQEIMDRYKS